MKRIAFGVLLLALLLGGQAKAQSYQAPLSAVSIAFSTVRFYFSMYIPKEIVVTSIGTGNTREAAVNNALHSAVQEAIGVMAVSETTVENDRLIRDIALNYSSGIVNEYKVLECHGATPVFCKVTATVSPWKFQRKLMADSATLKVNGENLYGQYETSRNTLIQRYKMTEYYLSQIHKSGLEVKIREMKVSHDASLYLDYEVVWNKEFKKNIIAYLERLEKDTNGQSEVNHQVYIQWAATGFFENRVRINTYDENFKRMMLHYMNQPISIGIPEFRVCDVHEPTGGVFGIDWYGFRKQKTIQVNPEKLRNIQKITVTIGCK